MGGWVVGEGDLKNVGASCCRVPSTVVSSWTHPPPTHPPHPTPPRSFHGALLVDACGGMGGWVGGWVVGWVERETR